MQLNKNVRIIKTKRAKAIVELGSCESEARTILHVLLFYGLFHLSSLPEGSVCTGRGKHLCLFSQPDPLGGKAQVWLSTCKQAPVAVLSGSLLREEVAGTGPQVKGWQGRRCWGRQCSLALDRERGSEMAVGGQPLAPCKKELLSIQNIRPHTPVKQGAPCR